MALENSRRQRVVIVGAGFAGLRMARSLNNTEYDVFLLDSIITTSFSR